MPPKKDYDRIFLPFTVAVEKKINKLALFMERLEDDDTISEFQLRILLTHAEALRKCSRAKQKHGRRQDEEDAGPGRKTPATPVHHDPSLTS